MTKPIVSVMGRRPPAGVRSLSADDRGLLQLALQYDPCAPREGTPGDYLWWQVGWHLISSERYDERTGLTSLGCRELAQIFNVQMTRMASALNTLENLGYIKSVELRTGLTRSVAYALVPVKPLRERQLRQIIHDEDPTLVGLDTGEEVLTVAAPE